MKSPATLLKPALKLLAYGTLGCTSLVEVAASGSPGPATNATLLTILGGAALKSAGTLAGEVTGGFLHDFLKPGGNLTHQTVIDVTGEALGRSLAKIAAELQQSDPDHAGAEKLNEFIQRHRITQLQSRWHSFVTEQIRPQLLNLSGSELLQELGDKTLLQAEELAQLVILLTNDENAPESFLDDDALREVSVRLCKELPAAFTDVLTDPHSEKPYRLIVLEMLTEIYAGNAEALARLTEILAGQKTIYVGQEEALRRLEEILALIRGLLDKINRRQDEIPRQLPAPPPDFTGREDELNELRALVKSGSVTISSLHGMGGVGKTALALKLADEFKDDYPDGQIYLDLKGISRRSEAGLRQEPLTAVEVMSHVIRAWHPDEKLPDREAELAGRYRSVLADKRALLLFDNARNAAQLTPLIPANRQCLLLVTSRQRFALGGREPYDIDKLKPEDAVKLLRHNSSRLSEQDAKEIAEICDYLPMALKPAVSLLSQSRTMTPERLKKRLQDKKHLLSLEDVERKDEMLNISIEASFRLSYELLAEDETVCDLPQRWRTLAIFPDTFDASAAAAVWALDEDRAQEALDALDRYSLIEISKLEDADEWRYRLHDLVREFAETQLTDEERDNSWWGFTDHFYSVLAQATDLFKSGNPEAAMLLITPEMSNVYAGLEGGQEISLKCLDKIFAQKKGSVEAYAEYLAQVDRASLLEIMARNDAITYAEYLARVGLLCERLTLAIWEMEIFFQQRLPELSRRFIANFKQSLDREYKILEGLKKAVAEADKIVDKGYEQEALDKKVRELANEDELYRTLVTACEGRAKETEMSSADNLKLAFMLGRSWIAVGEPDRGIKYCEEGLAKAREIGDKEYEQLYLSLLGEASAISGNTSEAMDYYEKAIVAANERGDLQNDMERAGELGELWENLGNLKFMVKDWEQAAECYKQAFLIAQTLKDDRQSEFIWKVLHFKLIVVNVTIMVLTVLEWAKSSEIDEAKRLQIERSFLELMETFVERADWAKSTEASEVEKLQTIIPFIEVMEKMVEVGEKLGVPHAQYCRQELEQFRAELSQQDSRS